MAINNILVINVNWLGDVVFTTPVFRALRKNYPGARISCMAVPRVSEVLACIPDIDEIIVYDEERKHKSLWGKLKIIGELRKRKFDVAFLLRPSVTRAWLTFLAGIPQRVGYADKGKGRLLTQIVEPLNGDAHRLDHYLKVVESFGVMVKERTTALMVEQTAADQLDKILEAKGIFKHQEFIVINPGGNWDLKRWPAMNFKGLVERIAQGETKIIISGASKDQALAKIIIQELPTTNVTDLTGQLTLKQLIALMKRARQVVSADSGPLHLADSVGTKTVGIFGPTRPEITGLCGSGKGTILQKDVGCNRTACYHLQCPDNICMKAISIEDTYEAIEKITH